MAVCAGLSRQQTAEGSSCSRTRRSVHALLFPSLASSLCDWRLIKSSVSSCQASGWTTASTAPPPLPPPGLSVAAIARGSWVTKSASSKNWSRWDSMRRSGSRRSSARLYSTRFYSTRFRSFPTTAQVFRAPVPSRHVVSLSFQSCRQLQTRLQTAQLSEISSTLCRVLGGKVCVGSKQTDKHEKSKIKKKASNKGAHTVC